MAILKKCQLMKLMKLILQCDGTAKFKLHHHIKEHVHFHNVSKIPCINLIPRLSKRAIDTINPNFPNTFICLSDLLCIC